jgi:hypothetical protein
MGSSIFPSAGGAAPAYARSTTFTSTGTFVHPDATGSDIKGVLVVVSGAGGGGGAGGRVITTASNSQSAQAGASGAAGGITQGMLNCSGFLSITIGAGGAGGAAATSTAGTGGASETGNAGSDGGITIVNNLAGEYVVMPGSTGGSGGGVGNGVGPGTAGTFRLPNFYSMAAAPSSGVAANTTTQIHETAPTIPTGHPMLGAVAFSGARGASFTNRLNSSQTLGDRIGQIGNFAATSTFLLGLPSVATDGTQGQNATTVGAVPTGGTGRSFGGTSGAGTVVNNVSTTVGVTSSPGETGGSGFVKIFY